MQCAASFPRRSCRLRRATRTSCRPPVAAARPACPALSHLPSCPTTLPLSADDTARMTVRARVACVRVGLAVDEPNDEAASTYSCLFPLLLPSCRFGQGDSHEPGSDGRCLACRQCHHAPGQCARSRSTHTAERRGAAAATLGALQQRLIRRQHWRVTGNIERVRRASDARTPCVSLLINPKEPLKLKMNYDKALLRRARHIMMLLSSAAGAHPGLHRRRYCQSSRCRPPAACSPAGSPPRACRALASSWSPPCKRHRAGPAHRE